MEENPESELIESLESLIFVMLTLSDVSIWTI